MPLSCRLETDPASLRGPELPTAAFREESATGSVVLRPRLLRKVGIRSSNLRFKAWHACLSSHTVPEFSRTKVNCTRIVSPREQTAPDFGPDDYEAVVERF